MNIKSSKKHYPKFEISAYESCDKDEHGFNKILDLYEKNKNEILLKEGIKPNFFVPDDKKKSLSEKGLYLFSLCKKGLEQRYGVNYGNQHCQQSESQKKDLSKKLCERLEYELSLIIGEGFTDYFLIHYDISNWARQNNIQVGPGRGTSPSSLIAYVLKITDIDPLRFELLFERMLSFERISEPCFDFTFNRSHEVIDYLRKKYGSEMLASIEKPCERFFEEREGVYSIALANQALDTLIPQFCVDGQISAQLPKDSLEELGILSLNFLDSKELETISELQEQIRKNNPNFDIEKIPLDDKATFELLSCGLTAGVYQFESDDMQDFCKKMSIDTFEEIYGLIALYRPGSMQFINQYIAGKKDKTKIQFPHPLLEGILSETYGVFLYQEQIMEALKILAAYTLGEADILRRVMGKKNPVEIEKNREIFISRAAEINNIKRNEATEIFDILLINSLHSFNKSHAISYALISYRMAYLKANFPEDFSLKV